MRAFTVTYLIEVLAEYCPNTRPLQTNATHIVVADLDNLLQREHARRMRAKFVAGHLHIFVLITASTRAEY